MTPIRPTLIAISALLLVCGCDNNAEPSEKSEAPRATPAESGETAPAGAQSAQPEIPPETTKTAATLFEEAQCRHLASAYEPALEHIDQALALEPEHPEALLLKARILTALDRKDDAFVALTALAKSTHPDASTFRAKIASDSDLAPLREDPRMKVFQ